MSGTPHAVLHKMLTVTHLQGIDLAVAKQNVGLQDLPLSPAYECSQDYKSNRSCSQIVDSES